MDDGIACVLSDLKLGWTARMTEDKVKIENILYKMEKLAVKNKMLLQREKFLCRKMNDQSYSMILEGFRS